MIIQLSWTSSSGSRSGFALSLTATTSSDLWCVLRVSVRDTAPPEITRRVMENLSDRLHQHITNQGCHLSCIIFNPLWYGVALRHYWIFDIALRKWGVPDIYTTVRAWNPYCILTNDNAKYWPHDPLPINLSQHVLLLRSATLNLN